MYEELREGGRERGKEGKKERGKEGERERGKGGREGEREGGRERERDTCTCTFDLLWISASSNSRALHAKKKTVGTPSIQTYKHTTKYTSQHSGVWLTYNLLSCSSVAAFFITSSYSNKTLPQEIARDYSPKSYHMHIQCTCTYMYNMHTILGS